MMQRTILTGLKDFFSFDKALIEKAVCVDEVDKLILEVLFQAGSEGKFPKYLARDPLLKRFQLSRFAVVRRLIQMNKRLKQEIGMSVVEKRGHKWALTSFAFKVWGETDEEGYEPDEEILDRRALM